VRSRTRRNCRRSGVRNSAQGQRGIAFVDVPWENDLAGGAQLTILTQQDMGTGAVREVLCNGIVAPTKEVIAKLGRVCKLGSFVFLENDIASLAENVKL
jgi:hypothetical protein